MKKQSNNQDIIDQNQKMQIPHYSDGSELIPSEIKSDLQSNDELVAGQTKYDEGIMNNFAQEPTISTATDSTSQQKFRHVFLGAAAIKLVELRSYSLSLLSAKE
jgi:hypothetical protein